MDSNNSEPSVKGKNRKRKTSFLKNARKYGKKGHFGRGSQLDPDTYHYFVRILETYKEGFSSEDDKRLFANNVFEQTDDKEIDCCCNQVGCRVVELLLPFANDTILIKFITAFDEEIRTLASDRFASHVLQCLVAESCKRTLNEELPETVRTAYRNFAVKVSKFLINNLEDYVWDTYGNHVIRSCLIHLTQLPVEKLDTNNEKVVPSEFVEIVRDYGSRIISWPQFSQLCMSDLTSALLQVLMKCLQKVDSKLLKSYLKKIFKEVFHNDSETKDHAHVLPPAFASQSVLMLMETSLQVCNSKMFSKLNSLFTGHLFKLSTTRSSNFAVQKLIHHCEDKAEFELIFGELEEHFQEIIRVGHSGVILALSETCKRLCAKQGNFVQTLMRAFDCFEPEDRQNSFLLCLSRFISYDINNKKLNENLQKEKLNLHGTLILQKLLHFNKPIKIVNAILSLEQNDLKNLFSNTMGSHIVDSYVKGPFVGEKSREKLVRKMMGMYRDLAYGKHGSRSFEALWNAANLKCKIQIMEELSHKDGSWINSEFGKIIAQKVNYTVYKRSKDEWTRLVKEKGNVCQQPTG